MLLQKKAPALLRGASYLGLDQLVNIIMQEGIVIPDLCFTFAIGQ